MVKSKPILAFVFLLVSVAVPQYAFSSVPREQVRQQQPSKRTVQRDTAQKRQQQRPRVNRQARPSEKAVRASFPHATGKSACASRFNGSLFASTAAKAPAANAAPARAASPTGIN